MFTLKIGTGGSAFYDDDGNRDPYEVIRLLRQVATKLENDYISGILIDINGNKVGEWYYDE